MTGQSLDREQFNSCLHGRRPSVSFLSEGLTLCTGALHVLMAIAGLGMPRHGPAEVAMCCCVMFCDDCSRPL